MVEHVTMVTTPAITAVLAITEVVRSEEVPAMATVHLAEVPTAIVIVPSGAARTAAEAVRSGVAQAVVVVRSEEAHTAAVAVPSEAALAAVERAVLEADHILAACRTAVVVHTLTAVEAVRTSVVTDKQLKLENSDFGIRHPLNLVH